MTVRFRPSDTEAMRNRKLQQIAEQAAAGGGTDWTPTITAINLALSGKASASHGHSIANVTGLQDALDGKQPSGAYLTSVAWADVAGKPVLFDGAWASLTGKPSTFTPATHAHAIGDVTGLQGALDGKQVAGSYAAATHAHAIADVTGLQTALNGKQASGAYLTSVTWGDVSGKPSTFAPSTHAHAIADVTGLQTALDGKQASGAYLTANQTVTLSGDVAGSGTTAITATLATVNANTGSFGSASAIPVITVDAKGRITAVSTATPSGGGLVRTRYTLANAHTNSTITPSTIGSNNADTDWVHTLVAGKAYRFNIWANYQAAALTTGGRMNLLGAGGLAGNVQGMMWGGIAQAAAASTLEVPIFSFANGTGAFLLTTAVNPINSPHIWGAEFVFVCTTGGTLALQWASEVAASAAQLNVGSTLLVEELS